MVLKNKTTALIGAAFRCLECDVTLLSRNTWRVQVLRSPKEAFAVAMQSWRERCEKCVCLQGDYVEKLLHFQLPVVSSYF